MCSDRSNRSTSNHKISWVLESYVDHWTCGWWISHEASLDRIFIGNFMMLGCDLSNSWHDTHLSFYSTWDVKIWRLSGQGCILHTQFVMWTEQFFFIFIESTVYTYKIWAVRPYVHFGTFKSVLAGLSINSLIEIFWRIPTS